MGDEKIRMYSIVVSTLVMLLGSAQIRSWFHFPPRERLLWLAVAVLNLTVLVGSVEALVRDVPGGIRVELTALAVTWLLAAVLYHPVAALLARRRLPKESA